MLLSLLLSKTYIILLGHKQNQNNRTTDRSLSWRNQTKQLEKCSSSFSKKKKNFFFIFLVWLRSEGQPLLEINRGKQKQRQSEKVTKKKVQNSENLSAKKWLTRDDKKKLRNSPNVNLGKFHLKNLISTIPRPPPLKEKCLTKKLKDYM